jgi:hypothetical protein
MNARYLTVRNLPPDISAALQREKRRRGTSLNQTVIDLLKQSLGVSAPRSNGLSRFAGTWSAEDEREFLTNIRDFEKVDPELWK